MASPIYNLILYHAYYYGGFFNLGVQVDELIRSDNGEITLFLGDERRKIRGRVDRKANRNGTPRIFGSGLLAWFKQDFQLMDPVDVVILSPDQLWLKKPVGETSAPLASRSKKPVRKQPSKINDDRNFQRVGADNNAQVGDEFECAAQNYFAEQGVNLTRNHTVSIGVSVQKKRHKFDLGCDDPKLIIECKSHTWTITDKVPSAKMTVWNEAMFYFFLAPEGYRKILFALKSYSSKRGKTLAEYYVQTYGHLIPPGVEIMEYDLETRAVILVKGSS